jgi:hypothetical protein
MRILDSAIKDIESIDVMDRTILEESLLISLREVHSFLNLGEDL